ncbi:MAG TPA: hypothetical protein VI432_01295, partial [Candidatus Paceibacterota bacterium]
MSNVLIEKLRDKLIELSHFGCSLSLLGWDQEVNMPPKGADKRADTIAYFTGLAHQKLKEIDKDKTLTKLIKLMDADKLSAGEKAVVREVKRGFDKMIRLPDSFIKELAGTASKAQSVWVEARHKSDFDMFLPWLKKIITLKRKEAELIGYKFSPYDALLDTFEPELTAEDTSRILNDLKDFLVPFIEQIRKSKSKIVKKLGEGKFAVDKQIEFNKLIALKMGFDIDAGRIDKSAHPFTT